MYLFFYKYKNLEVMNIPADSLYDYSFKDISLNGLEI